MPNLAIWWNMISLPTGSDQLRASIFSKALVHLHFRGFRPLFPTLENQRYFCESFLTPLEQRNFESQSALSILTYSSQRSILNNANSYTLNGIRKLGLDFEREIDPVAFKERFEKLTQWSLPIMDRELSPLEFFQLIKRRQFPLSLRIRDLSQVYWAAGPDFWHEAMGHLCILVEKEIQDLWVEIASIYLALPNNHLGSIWKSRLVNFFWNIFEYGFILEGNRPRFLGAAHLSSIFSQKRFELGILGPRLWKPEHLFIRRAFQRRKTWMGQRLNLLNVPMVSSIDEVRKSLKEFMHSL